MPREGIDGRMERRSFAPELPIRLTLGAPQSWLPVGYGEGPVWRIRGLPATTADGRTRDPWRERPPRHEHGEISHRSVAGLQAVTRAPTHRPTAPPLGLTRVHI